ncbi:glutamine synthetase/guanido kinase [Dichomitus squalens]|uniref:Glutamine synthetase n=1 Tax=Dichomitus squalens TaxID=114155 RepID=A0A4Q9MKS4_9APHY|nr:glutamine synthetase/guanido kinase [Dichomitus squalens]
MPTEPSPYGVLYTPDPTASSIPAKSVDELLTPAIKFVRIQWIDFINTVRFRVVPASYFRALYANPASRPGVGLGTVALGLVGLATAPGFSPVGGYIYVPDLASWRVCPYAPGHASVMGWFEERTPSPETGLSVAICPRTILDRLVKEAQDKAGVSFLIGMEFEFILVTQIRPEVAYASNADWSTSAKLRTGSAETQALEEIAQCLLDAGIELQMYHAEAAPGQYEIVTGPLAPLEAADAVVFTREAIYNIAHKHGFKATFAPRVHNNSAGSGAHTNISVHGGNNAPRAADAASAPNLTPAERSFLQGVLAHLPAICALTLPTAASYARMQDGIWSGGTLACWGTENRESPVRLCGPQGHYRFEVRPVDGTATPHLAFAALLGAGLRGILDGAVLTTGDCPTPAFQMSDAEKRAVGLENALRLPQTIEDARKSLGLDAVLKTALGEEFIEKYLGLLQTFMAGNNDKETIEKLIEYF